MALYFLPTVLPRALSSEAVWCLHGVFLFSPCAPSRHAADDALPDLVIVKRSRTPSPPSPLRTYSSRSSQSLWTCTLAYPKLSSRKADQLGESVQPPQQKPSPAIPTTTCAVPCGL